MLTPHARRRALAVPLLVAFVAAGLTTAIASALLSAFFLTAWSDDQAVLVGLGDVLVFVVRDIAASIGRIPGGVWLGDPNAALGYVVDHGRQGLANADVAERFAFVFASCGLCGVVGGVAAFSVVWRATPRMDAVKHLDGRRLVLGAHAIRQFKKANKTAVAATTPGLELAPGMVMSRERETRHLLLIGGTGSGKSVIVRSLLRQLLDRPDRLLIHDTKGDITESLPLEKFVLLAPHDERSAVWDIAADIRTAQDAREFSAAFISDSREPMWSDGAREILTGAIVCLIGEFGENWSWPDLGALLFGDLAMVRGKLERYYPPATGYVEFENNNAPTRATQSFIVTMRACLAGTVLPLAEAWPRYSSKVRFSIRDWLANQRPENRVVVMQRAPHLPELSRAWIGALVRIFANHAVGPLLPDDPNRRIWAVLDEFPQLGQLDGFQQVLEAGRSRGVCAILAMQDIAQIKEIYGENIAASWLSSISTKIIGRLEGGSTATFICNELVNQRIIEWTEKSKSTNPVKADGTGGGASHSYVTKHEQAPVITPAFLESELGRQDDGLVPTIKALILGVDALVLEARWPIEAWPKRRPATVPAAWNNPDHKRP